MAELSKTKVFCHKAFCFKVHRDQMKSTLNNIPLSTIKKIPKKKIILQFSCPCSSMSPLPSHIPFYCCAPKLGFYVRTRRATCSASSSDCPAQFKVTSLDNKQTSSD